MTGDGKRAAEMAADGSLFRFGKRVDMMYTAPE
jgi:hypothetical protein